MPVAVTRKLFHLFVDESFHHTQTRLGSGLLDGAGYVKQDFTHRQYHLEAGLAVRQRYRNCLVVELTHLSL